MTRRCHTLQSNKTSQSPQAAIWVDTETNSKQITNDSVRCELMQGMACYRRTNGSGEWGKPDWIRFITIDEYWSWVATKVRPKTKLYMFAHNWAFDAPVLDMFNVLPDKGWHLKSAVINSPPIILRWKRANATIEVLDTLNIWRMPLKNLGKSLDLPKLDMPSTNAAQSDWDTYNKRDVEIIMQATIRWFGFLRDNDLGGFAPTIASQAMRTYRHKFMSKKIVIDDDDNALKLARRSLHGGRCECHIIGKVPYTVHKLDINSQYPAIMATELMPARLLRYYTKCTVTDLRRYLTKYCVTAEVLIATPQPVYPVKIDGKLVFPVGQFRTVLSTPELIYAVDHKHIMSVGAIALYEAEILFTDYVKYFADYRQKSRDAGNSVDALSAKIMSNSLYGKWAQKGIYYSIVAETDDNNIKVWLDYDVGTKSCVNMRQYAGIIEQQEKITESRDSHPAIAAHITAHARIQLWGLMCGAGHGNYCYNDTDSLWTNEIGAANLEEFVHETELGKLKLEGVHKRVIIHGPKDYMLDDKKRIKGIKFNAKQIDGNTFEQVKFTTLVGLIRRGDLTAPIVSQITKQLRRIYNKGTVQTDGRVVPLRLFL